MSPATWPRDAPLDERLLVIDPRASRWSNGRVRDLPAHFAAGDLVIVNDAATLPASLHGRTPTGEAVELRLLARAKDGTWEALLFGAGDWRTRTEDRPLPPRLARGATIVLDRDLSASVVAVSPASPRIVTLRFDRDGGALWSALYRVGRPIQYAYVDRPLALWHVQTSYASRPWSSEMPSAGRPLTWELLLALRRRGVALATLTHAAGISSTGDPSLDALLPMRESFDIPAATIAAILETKRRGGRVVAVGTSVVRALEGCAAAHDGALVPGEGTTDLRLDASASRRVVDGLFTGMHEPSASHFDLLQAFTPRALLERAYAHAEGAGFLCHEFGDSALILAGSLEEDAGGRSTARGNSRAMKQTSYREPSESRVAEIVRSAGLVAVVGIKDERARFEPAYTVPERMQGYGIRVIPVNPTIDASLGVLALDRVSELKEQVDIVQIFRRADAVTALADEIVALPPTLRPKVAWMQTGIVNEGAAEKLQNAGIEVVMDRCFAVDAAKYRR
jgi:S-adenosylmethionine:tRNA ribosyltransferase-isomerase